MQRRAFLGTGLAGVAALVTRGSRSAAAPTAVEDDHVKPLGIPAWRGAQFGHVERQLTLPLGLRVEVDADQGTIRMLERAVA